MKMSIQDALSILEIELSHVNETDIKLAYRKAAKKFHPDRNPAGLEMMKLINAAYETLKDFSGDVESNGTKGYGEEINAALNAIITLGLSIEVCGAWVWVTGNTKPHKEVLGKSGFKWSNKKVMWYFRPENYKSRRHQSWSMDQIRHKYGSQNIRTEQKTIAS